MRRRTVKDDGPDPIDQYVGSRVRARRVGLRMSQTRLGDAINVTFQQIQKYENGTNRIGASNLYKVAKTLGVEVGFFFEGMPDFDKKSKRGRKPKETAETPFKEDPLTSREAIELMHNYFRVDDEQVRRRLAQFVKTLARTMGSR